MRLLRSVREALTNRLVISMRIAPFHRFILFNPFLGAVIERPASAQPVMNQPLLF